jgi:hypothetical protein
MTRIGVRERSVSRIILISTKSQLTREIKLIKFDRSSLVKARPVSGRGHKVYRYVAKLPFSLVNESSTYLLGVSEIVMSGK